jgi:transcriptional regulator with XRE-family HTH domain
VFVSKEDLGLRLRMLRRSRRLRQQDVARILGVHQSHVSNVERGDRGLTIQQVAKLSKALGVSADMLLGSRPMPQEPKPLRSTRLLRCMERIESLPPADQNAVIRILEGLVVGRLNGAQNAHEGAAQVNDPKRQSA